MSGCTALAPVNTPVFTLASSVRSRSLLYDASFTYACNQGLSMVPFTGHLEPNYPLRNTSNYSKLARVNLETEGLDGPASTAAFCAVDVSSPRSGCSGATTRYVAPNSVSGRVVYTSSLPSTPGTSNPNCAPLREGQ